MFSCSVVQLFSCLVVLLFGRLVAAQAVWRWCSVGVALGGAA